MQGLQFNALGQHGAAQKILVSGRDIAQILVPAQILNIRFHQRGKRLDSVHLGLFLANHAIYHLAQRAGLLIRRVKRQNPECQNHHQIFQNTHIPSGFYL